MGTSLSGVAIFVLIYGLTLYPCHCLAAKQRDKAVITKPEDGDHIEGRIRFLAEGSIPAYLENIEKGYHYWISLADSKDRKLGKRHWPKFHIEGSLFRGSIDDGGQCSTGSEEEYKVVLLKVPDATNADFDMWFDKHRGTTVWPHRELNHKHVIHQVTIYFCGKEAK